MHATTMEIHRRVAGHIGKYDPLLEIVKKRKLIWIVLALRAKGTVVQTILQGKVEGKITMKAGKAVVG